MKTEGRVAEQEPGPNGEASGEGRGRAGTELAQSSWEPVEHTARRSTFLPSCDVSLKSKLKQKEEQGHRTLCHMHL